MQSNTRVCPVYLYLENDWEKWIEKKKFMLNFLNQKGPLLVPGNIAGNYTFYGQFPALNYIWKILTFMAKKKTLSRQASRPWNQVGIVPFQVIVPLYEIDIIHPRKNLVILPLSWAKLMINFARKTKLKIIDRQAVDDWSTICRPSSPNRLLSGIGRG